LGAETRRISDRDVSTPAIKEAIAADMTADDLARIVDTERIGIKGRGIVNGRVLASVVEKAVDAVGRI
jgi:hypothetical protein